MRTNWEWEQFGEDIRRTVQDAVDSRDFRRLNQTITDTVNSALHGFTGGMRGITSGIPVSAGYVSEYTGQRATEWMAELRSEPVKTSYVVCEDAGQEDCRHGYGDHGIQLCCLSF